MTANPWDRPPIQANGDARKNNIYRGVGLALSNWEYYEFSLGLIFRVIINADWDGPVEQAFGSILIHKGRVEMLQAASKVYFRRHDSVMKTRLSKMLENANKLCARRNEIAHGHVTHYWEEGERRRGWYLLPSYFATNKHEVIGLIVKPPSKFTSVETIKPKRRPLYAYTAQDIEQFADAFWNLAQEAGKVAGQLIDYRLDAKMRALAGDNPELQQIWNETWTQITRSSELTGKRPKRAWRQ